MVIDKGKLIALLVDKTGHSKQEVEEQLNQLAKEIRQAAESGRQFHIEGFGTFGMEEGSMYFDASGQLETEINQKYAGMKPIELMAAFKESGAGVPVEEVKDEPVRPDPPVMDTEPEEDTPEIVEEPEEKQPEPSEKDDEEKTKEKPKPAPVAVSPKKEKQPKKPKKKTSPKKKVAAGASKKEDDPIGKFLFAAIVVIAVLAGGWFLYDSGVLNTSGSQNNLGGIPADTTAQNTDQPVPATSDSTLASADSTEQTTAAGVSESSAVEDETNSEPYGLKGALNEGAENAYTIVIHSFRLKSTVQEIADSLSGRGYRTVMFQGTANGDSRWRLGLGQFRSISQAQEAVVKLTEPYKENHFITRIQ